MWKNSIFLLLSSFQLHWVTFWQIVQRFFKPLFDFCTKALLTLLRNFETKCDQKKKAFYEHVFDLTFATINGLAESSC
jgi:TorA maturation chaperone TorD